MASGDVANAFYCIRPPEELAKMFTLDGVRAEEVFIDSLCGEAIPADSLLIPYLCVLPMGFSWALHFCQLSLENVISKIKNYNIQHISDKRKPVSLTEVTDVSVAA